MRDCIMKALWSMLAVAASLVVVVGCGAKENSQEEVLDPAKQPSYKGTLRTIRAEGALRVITPHKDESILPRKGSPLDFELSMARKFAGELGVGLKIVYSPSYDSIIPWLSSGKADVAVASLTVTSSRKTLVDFTNPLHHVKELLIGPAIEKGTISSVDQLAGRTVVVREHSSFSETLGKIKNRVPTLTIEHAPPTMHTEEIVHRVGKGTYPLTACDSDLASAIFEFRDDVTALLELSDSREIAWAVAKDCGDLLDKLNDFINEQKLAHSVDEIFVGDLDELEKRKVIRIATRNNAATYWIYRGKEVGFEFELCRAFAGKHGLRMEMRIVPDRKALLDWVVAGKADIAAASITVTEDRAKRVAFSSPYLFPREVVVCRKDNKGEPVVKDLADLANAAIHVRKSSSYYQSLLKAQERIGKKLRIYFVPEDMETEEILAYISDGTYEVTVSDDYLVQMELMHSKSIVPAFALSDTQHIAWAVRPESKELKKAIDKFFTKGKYAPRALNYNMLYKNYFKSAEQVAKAKSEGRSDSKGVLSEYDVLFKEYAQKFGFDWRMVAAQSYQESKFNPDARSWAGAVGLMQIMPRTGKELGVENISKPESNVYGGTKYMSWMLNRFDKTLPYSERYNFALASYNCGYGHVLDARRLAEELNRDPNTWFGNVEEAMLLLAKPQYAKRARYGYCRGREPVTYVENIRGYYTHYHQLVE